ncbi:MAG: hypothetical protein KDB53_03800, partial [Planctomycetes bacterium]|nr:hypothetical protein [Planctomycetota bacterium]
GGATPTRARFFTLPAGAAARLILDFPDDAPLDQLWLHGLATLDPKRLLTTPQWRTRRAGDDALRPKSGAMLVATRPPAIAIEADRAVLSFDTVRAERRIYRRLQIDHVCDRVSSFDLTLDGRPLVRIISQPLPRAAKVELVLPVLDEGEHVLEFQRLDGQGQLRVEALRLLH